MSEVISFRAELVPVGSGYVCAYTSKAVSSKLGSGRVPVVVRFGAQEFRTSMFPVGEGRHMMLVNKQMRAKADVDVGDRPRFELRIDTEPRKVQVPADVATVLKKSPLARKVFDKLPYSHQKEHIDSIEEAKRPETRARRIEKMMERLKG